MTYPSKLQVYALTFWLGFLGPFVWLWWVWR